ncbi:MAG: hypothetical protein H0U60_00800 [Blastocatellia bacterium]|nr:hypothetical protein [Blastocatellia bacterium]
MFSVLDPQGELKRTLSFLLFTVTTKIACAVPLLVAVTVLEVGDTCITPELPGVAVIVTLPEKFPIVT